ncbi:hypothetical protein AM1_3346 [Acaryochloris marina MBIC11017]|uniref:Uncharacterized protein n=1 Tax=Acaryochloris marina (strain MBIC 11017) TaxID=329726 RepID=B0BZ40_ACAM1|nr:hypothetical protein AM1_3346 [Acaryochloris marina MBIC11017]
MLKPKFKRSFCYHRFIAVASAISIDLLVVWAKIVSMIPE